MIEAAPTITLSPQAGLLLTKITDTPDLESALWRVLHDYTKLKTAQLQQEVKALELKWQMTFEEFSQRCQDGSLGRDPYTYEVESDFWDWEKATTLLQHLLLRSLASNNAFGVLTLTTDEVGMCIRSRIHPNI